jgi:hypothetical protein
MKVRTFNGREGEGENAAAAFANLVERELGEKAAQDALLGWPAAPLDYVDVGVDWGSGESRSVFVCSCGFETDSERAVAKHVAAHGARAVSFTPLVRSTALDQARRI